ncbi:hypothetical protein ATANTOWER_015196 [Ataeniobius toweri]|uniref:Uncharacterized protein n=1 Tax=Ataeniobius toweri TaxID=208326 RepID=A0ABU7C0R7_9TELE|nr:hypothetical protein [Ataeniobius toweri]
MCFTEKWLQDHIFDSKQNIRFTQMSRTRTHRLPLYPGPGRRGSRLSRDALTSFFPDTSSSSSGGSPRRSQASHRHSPSSMSWAVPWASPRWDVLGTPPKEGV